MIEKVGGYVNIQLHSVTEQIAYYNSATLNAGFPCVCVEVLTEKHSRLPPKHQHRGRTIADGIDISRYSGH